MRMRIEIRRFIMESNKHVVLIRAPKHEDSYEKALQEANLSVHFVKAVNFEYINVGELISALHLKYGGMIFTSQTAVDSLTHAITQSGGELADVLKQWKDVPIFVVGKATAAAVHQLGFKSTGSTSGNAEQLAKNIVEFFSGQENSTVLPLLFPCGILARDILPTTLGRVGLIVKSVICYNTIKDPMIEQSLNTLSQEGVFSGQFCVTFFSPSGVQFILPSLKSYCDLQTLKTAAIGPTTAEALRCTGVSPVVALTPSPDALVNALQQIW